LSVCHSYAAASCLARVKPRDPLFRPGSTARCFYKHPRKFAIFPVAKSSVLLMFNISLDTWNKSKIEGFSERVEIRARANLEVCFFRHVNTNFLFKPVKLVDFEKKINPDPKKP